MLTVYQAEKLITESLPSYPETAVEIEALTQEILAEPILADRDGPAFDRIAMDGFAIKYSEYASGGRSFAVQTTQKAGTCQTNLISPKATIEVMTGGVLPHGTDTVIPVENTKLVGNTMSLKKEITVQEGQNIHFRGSDFLKGTSLITTGSQMTIPRWTIAAATGKATLQVKKRPKIAIISNGDELVDIREEPRPHQIRSTNGWTLLASLRQRGYSDCEMFHLPDDKYSIHKAIKAMLEKFDVLVLSGGVSMGKFDFIPQVLHDLKVEQVFHKIKQKPGKPLWFGKSHLKQLVFGLPGNPMSALICLHRYVLTALDKSLGIAANHRGYAILSEACRKKPGLACFIPVKARFSQNGTIQATPISFNGSGDYSSLGDSTGFIEIAENEKPEVGQAYPLFMWSSPSA